MYFFCLWLEGHGSLSITCSDFFWFPHVMCVSINLLFENYRAQSVHFNWVLFVLSFEIWFCKLVKLFKLFGQNLQAYSDPYFWLLILFLLLSWTTRLLFVDSVLVAATIFFQSLWWVSNLELWLICFFWFSILFICLSKRSYLFSRSTMFFLSDFFYGLLKTFYQFSQVWKNILCQ